MMASRPLILASASPRRARLLDDAGYSFEQVTPPFDDSEIHLDLPPHELARELAARKAESVARDRSSGVLLGCDTLLAVEGRPIGKPSDANHARSILARLFDRPHEVISAVCLLDAATSRRHAFRELARVTISHPGHAALESYLAAGEWRGKAGGYNLAELSGRWRFEVAGDPTTVIGLPMRRLNEELRQFAPDLLPNE